MVVLGLPAKSSVRLRVRVETRIRVKVRIRFKGKVNVRYFVVTGLGIGLGSGFRGLCGSGWGLRQIPLHLFLQGHRCLNATGHPVLPIPFLGVLVVIVRALD